MWVKVMDQSTLKWVKVGKSTVNGTKVDKNIRQRAGQSTIMWAKVGQSTVNEVKVDKSIGPK